MPKMILFHTQELILEKNHFNAKFVENVSAIDLIVQDMKEKSMMVSDIIVAVVQILIQLAQHNCIFTKFTN